MCNLLYQSNCRNLSEGTGSANENHAGDERADVLSECINESSSNQ